MHLWYIRIRHKNKQLFMYRHRYKYIVVLWDPLWVFETVVFQNDFGEDFGVFLGKIQDAGLFETSHRHNHKSLGV